MRVGDEVLEVVRDQVSERDRHQAREQLGEGGQRSGLEPAVAGGQRRESQEDTQDQRDEHDQGCGAELLDPAGVDAEGPAFVGGPLWGGEQPVEVDAHEHQQDEHNAAGAGLERHVKAAGEAAAAGGAVPPEAEASPGVEQAGEHLAAGEPGRSKQEPEEQRHRPVDDQHRADERGLGRVEVEDQLTQHQQHEQDHRGPPGQSRRPLQRRGAGQDGVAQRWPVGESGQVRERIPRPGPVPDQAAAQRQADPEQHPEEQRRDVGGGLLSARQADDGDGQGEQDADSRSDRSHR